MTNFENSPFAQRPQGDSPGGPAGQQAPQPGGPFGTPPAQPGGYQGSYGAPPQQQGYQPQGGYAPPPPPQGYQPQGGYAPPPQQQGYQPPGGYAPPQHGYQPQPGGYAPPAGGFQPYGGPGVPQDRLAQWPQRVIAFLIDGLVQLPAAIVYGIGLGLAVANSPTVTTSGRVISAGNGGLAAVGWVLAVVGGLGMFAIAIWNLVLRQGKTGYSIGKSKIGLKLVDAGTQQPIGPAKAFLRQLCHALDGVAYIGYLWPLWDERRQTFADKIINTLVLKER